MQDNVIGTGQIINNSARIMLIDDDRDFLWVLTKLLNLHGYTVSSASNGDEALDIIRSTKPDMVILDINMPGMDGWETFQLIRTQSDAPVLILTGSEPGASKLSNPHDSLNDLMTKPFHSSQLLDRVAAMLDQAAGRISNPIQVLPKTFFNGRPSVSVIIPTMNEAKNIPLLLPYLPMEQIDEVILVDGRSTDGTIETARRIMPAIKVVIEKKPGKGAALVAGYRAATSDILIVLDADGSNDPREIPRFIQALMQGADFVKGSRFASGGGTNDMPRIRRFGNSVFVQMVNFLFNTTYTDLCYGYHAFWCYSLCSLDLSGVDGFEIDTALYIRALIDRLKITEVPSFEGYRFYGKGKLRTIPDGFRVLRTIFTEYLRNVFHPNNEMFKGFRGEVISNSEEPSKANVQRSLPEQRVV